MLVSEQDMPMAEQIPNGTHLADAWVARLGARLRSAAAARPMAKA
jgi:hypothetical protein